MSDTIYTIRQATADDAASYNAHLLKMVEEPHNGISRHAGEYTETVEETRNHLTSIYESHNQVIFIALNTDNQVIGDCSGFASQRISRQHNVGIGLTVDADYRRQGIATALMKQMIQWAYATSHVYRLELEVFTDNLRALNLYLKLGFVLEGTRHKAFRKHGQFKDAYIMAILFEREDG